MRSISNLRGALYELEGELTCIEIDARYCNSQVELRAGKLKNDVANLCDLLTARTHFLTADEIAMWEEEVDYIYDQIADIYETLPGENDET